MCDIQSLKCDCVESAEKADSLFDRIGLVCAVWAVSAIIGMFLILLIAQIS